MCMHRMILHVSGVYPKFCCVICCCMLSVEGFQIVQDHENMPSFMPESLDHLTVLTLDYYYDYGDQVNPTFDCHEPLKK